MWCLVRVLLRFYALTYGSGAVLSAPRRAGCVGPGGSCGGASSRFGTWVGRGAFCIATGPGGSSGLCDFGFAQKPDQAGDGFGRFGLGWLVHV